MTRKYPPLAANHPMVGDVCPICAVPFRPGDEITLVPLGPDRADPEALWRARDDRPYNAQAAPVHFDCRPPPEAT